MKASEYIFDQIQQGNLDAAAGKSLLEEVLPDDIAIVGMSCEYTDVKDTFEFYNTVKYGKRGFKPFPNNRVQYIPKDHSYLYNGAKHLNTTPEEFLERLCAEKGSYLEDIDSFDYSFFGIAKEEARYVDPTHRLVMKHSYLAMEDAGITLDKIKDSRTAIYIGKDKSITASYRSEIEEDSTHVNAGTWEGILASRLNYIYNLTGGSFVLDTACSSSLVAAHLAVKTLRDKEIDAAIVGGIALGLFPRQGSVIDQYSNVETPRSFLKVFDAESQGTIFGEGVGIVILKRLKDAIADNDNIYTIIRGSMINSDGRSNGLTAPNPHAQKDLLLDAYQGSGISPETIEYIDAHGTGTKLGDPIEARGLTDAYRKYSSERAFCALTSLKENLGHTVGAAGVGGIIKMSLALRNKEIFPNKSFEAPNEYIRFIDSPFYIPTKAAEWVKRGKYPRRGGVSSFGFSGTNAHVILEEYDQQQNKGGDDNGQAYPFVFSSQSAEQLADVLRKFVVNSEYLSRYSLRNMSYTLVRRRNRFPVAVGFTAASKAEFAEKVQQALAAVESGRGSETIHYAAAPQSITVDMKKLMQHQLRTAAHSFTLDELIKLSLEGHESALEGFEYGDATTVSLPTYEFKREPLWATVKQYSRHMEAASGPSLPVKATLIKKQTLKSDKADVYEVTLKSDDWYVDDHRIGGKRTFSGTTYMSLSAEIAVLYFQTPAFTLEKIYFKNLIQLDDASTKTFYIHVNKANAKQLDIEVFSYEEGDMERSVSHAVFTLKAAEAPAAPAQLEISQFESVLVPTVLGTEKNEFFKERWDFVNNDFRMMVSQKEIILSLDLRNDYAHDLNDFHLHPSMLDGILGGMVYERAQATKRTYLPLSYGKFTYTGERFTQKIYSVAELLYDVNGNHDVISANVSVYNAEGRLIAHLDKYTMKAFANMFFKPYLHAVQWERSSIRPAVESLPELAGASVLVIGNAAALSAESTASITLDRVNYMSIGQFKPEERYDYVIYAPWFGEQEPGSETISQELVHYFSFAKSASKLVKRGGKLIVAADNGFALETSDNGHSQKAVNPLNYSLLSSGRILGLENTGFSTLMVNTPVLELDSLLTLALTEELNGKKIITENGVIYEESLVEVKNVEHRELSLADDETVIVTGGYGGIGLVYVDHLLDVNPNAHIAILGRTDTLAVLEAKQELNEQERNKLEQIKAIYSKGANVKFYACDLASESNVKEVVGGLTAAGKVAGVIHLAGVPEEGMLFAKSEEEFLRITAPKVLGTILLRKYADSDKLRFFTASSTMTTIVGSAGQFSYTVANAFLEGTALSDERFTTVQWPGWNDTGMALGFGDLAAADEYLLLKSVSSLVGREYIRLLLRAGNARVIAGEFNTAKASDLLGSYIKLPQAYIRNAAGSAADAEAAVSIEAPAPYQIKDYASLTITGTDSQDEVEKFVTVVFASVLERDEIDVNKSFTDLGGDSLKAFGIYGPIAEQYKVDIEVADVFIYSTITQLSNYVKELLEDAA